jgi:hypothetical protein
MNNDNSGLWWLIIIGVILWWLYDSGFGDCEEYGSDYSCKFVVERADYEVYYWRNLQAENPDDEFPIGRVVGLRECKNVAMQHAAVIGESWNDRAYICVLVIDGNYMEKHRLLDAPIQ